MEDVDLEQRSHALRLELKAWEKQFALENEGRKAGREDIKANLAISQKYKEYNRMRDVLSGKVAPQTPSKRATRISTQAVERTPKACSTAITSTPLKRKQLQATETAAEFLSPQGPTFLGPTPQRDGIVLGLFDVLPAETPSKRRKVLADIEPNVLQTPSKSNEKAESDASFETAIRGVKTPQSSGKRFLLDRFVTPKRRKLDEHGTPTSTLKEFATPSFLRRDNVLKVIDEETEPTPRPLPWKRRGLGRSLSSMIQAMRKEEEDRLDEDADILRELEMEAEGIIPPARKPRVPDILVEDSQAAMPLGPDRLANTSEDEDKEEVTAIQGKVWKKRGLKRQTRRVIMRPSTVKPRPQPAAPNCQDSDDEDDDRETQHFKDSSNDHDASNKALDHDTEAAHTPKKSKAQRKRAGDNTQEGDKATGDGPVKTAARKIKATAHANYRRLKIKSKGNGGKGRFGRRR